MKIIKSLFFFLIPSLCFANCPNNDLFVKSGWGFHESSEFSFHEKRLSAVIENGKRDGSVIDDMYGQILTPDTVSQLPIRLEVFSYDNLKTDRDLMFGDYAVMIDPESGKLAELRWFDGVKRNVVINEKILTCVSEAPPFVENSIL